ncbi:hypothetical protein E3N88_04510 [Mikania micrantha]|uniref:Uncharacterized protein n=1 Tax=Mikania micrantha TaxID=192012 RepID=A0A5N6PV63_9ASTR|nr:hypothetical protein E3N88_04510 [Mikania micrantha]
MVMVVACRNLWSGEKKQQQEMEMEMEKEKAWCVFALAGKKQEETRNVKDCAKCPQEVKDELKAHFLSQNAKKTNEGLHDMEDEAEDDDVMEIPDLQNKRKRPDVKGPIDLYMTKGMLNFKSSQPSSSKPTSSKFPKFRTLIDEDSVEDQEGDGDYIIQVDDTSDGFKD